MLRGIKHPHLRPRLQGLKLTTAAAGTAVLDIGSEEASAVRASAGKATITPGEVFSREGLTLVTPGADVAQGGYGTYDTTHAGTTLTSLFSQKDGTADDGTGYVFTLGYLDTETIRLEPYQSVRTPCQAPRLMAFRLTSAGAIGLGKSQATNSLASGVHTLTFTDAFGRACVAIASPIAAARKSVRVTSTSASQVAIEGFDPVTDDDVEAIDMYVVVLGWNHPDEHGGHRRVVQCPQIAPRIEAYAIDGTGTPALGLGSTDGTLTTNGTGDYSVTFKQPFAREPIVIVTGKDYPAQLAEAATTTGFNCLAFDETTHAAADDDIYALVIGFDNDTEV